MNAWLAQHWQALALALRRLVATPVNTLLSLLAIGIALALPAGGQMLLANALQLARDGAPTPRISLYADLAADRRAVQQIEARLKNHPAIKSAQLIPREATLARMKSGEGLGDVIDAKRFAAAIYPGHPYGASATVESVAGIARDDLVAFHRDHYSARRSVVSIIGDMTRAEAERIAQSLTESLPAGLRRHRDCHPRELRQHSGRGD